MKVAKKRRVGFLVVIVFSLLLIAVPGYSSTSEFDKYGGWTKLKGKSTGFFHPEQIDGRWWFITPDGNAFLSIGVNIVRFSGDVAPSLRYSPYERNVSRKYKNDTEWKTKTAERLNAWGFNTVGAWSDDFSKLEKRIPYALALNFGTAGSADWRERSFPDVFSPDFEKDLQNRISKARKEDILNDPYLLGYFLDNEIHWGENVLRDTIESQEGRKVVIGYLKDKYKTIPAFSSAWGIEAKSFEDIKHIYKNKIKPDKQATPRISEDLAEIMRLIASRFFEVTTRAIRSADRNHMILGVRFLEKTPRVVVEECSRYCDVISVNYYPVKTTRPDQAKHKRGILQLLLPDNWLEEYHTAGKKPILITETSFKALDSGLPNKGGASVAVRTQKERAGMFEWFLKEIAEKPYIVGYHWFQYADQPKQGRFDGESNNFGVVDINDVPYAALTEKMTLLNTAYYRMRLRY
jgi:hypothetical protein